MRWRKERPEKVELEVTKIGASRAIYVDEDTQRVEMRMITTDKYEVLITLTPNQTRDLIEQLTMSYYAINPPLKTRRETYGQ